MKGFARLALLPMVAVLLATGPGPDPMAKQAEVSDEDSLTYKAITVSGEVLTRMPNADQWQTVVAGATLNAGQIVEVTPGASVRIAQRGHGKVAGMEAEEADLIINSAMLFRLGAKTLRKVNLARHFIDHLPIAMPASAQDGPSAPSFLHMDEAWHKVAAVFTVQGAGAAQSTADMAELEKQGMALGVASHNLRILTPVSNTQIVATEFPQEMTVAWAKSEAGDLDYDVYMWDARQKRGAAVAKTHDKHYTLTFTKPGTYFVQVSTKEGKWQSNAHLVNVLAAKARPVLAKDRVPGKATAGASELATIDWPPDSFTVFRHGDTPVIDFYWHTTGAVHPISAAIVILSANGAELQKQRAVNGHARGERLPAGEYRWYLEAEFEQGATRTSLQTEPRRLTIGVEPAKTDLVKNLMRPGLQGTFLLLDGL